VVERISLFFVMSAILDYNSGFTTAFAVALASQSTLFRTGSTFFRQNQVRLLDAFGDKKGGALAPPWPNPVLGTNGA
jgi:hypothetical protein